MQGQAAVLVVGFKQRGQPGRPLFRSCLLWPMFLSLKSSVLLMDFYLFCSCIRFQ